MQGPMNIGNPNEFTILELAEKVQQVVNAASTLLFCENTSADPHKRQPVNTLAKRERRWEPKVQLLEGLALMKDDFEMRLKLKKRKTMA